MDQVPTREQVLANATICPSLEAKDWPLGEWPEANRMAGLVISIFYTAFTCGSLLWMMWRRKHPSMRGRDKSLIAMSCFGTMLLVPAIPLREYITREEFPCDLYLWVTMLSVPLLCGPIIVRLLQYKYKLEWQDAIKNIPLNPASGMENGDTLDRWSHTEMITTKFLASRLNAYKSIGVFLGISVSVILVYYLFSSRYGSGCSGCEVESADSALFLLSILFTSILTVYAIRRLPKDQDHPPVVAELKLVSYLFALTIIVWYIVFKVDPSDLQQDGYLTWSYLLVFTATWFVAYQVTLPVIRTYISSNSDDQKLMSILGDPISLDLFRKHLKVEFSSENLRFWEDSTNWHKRGEDLVESNESFANWQREGHDIYNTYIRDNSILQINLSSRVLKPLKAVFEESSIDTKVDAKVFDDAIDEIFALMEMDGFRRFVKTDEYQNWIKHQKYDNPKSGHSKSIVDSQAYSPSIDMGETK